MLAVDTTVLVRVLVDDPAAPDQCRAARELVSKAGDIYLSQSLGVHFLPGVGFVK